MLSILASIPIFSILVMVQSAVISRLPLIQGFPDLVMLTIIAWALQERVTTYWQWGIVGALMTVFVSSIPAPAPILAYLLAIGVIRVIQGRVWKTPILSMLITTIIGTFIYHILSIFMLNIYGVTIDVRETFKTITLPSMLLNLGLSIPVFIVVKEIALLFFPEKDEV